MFDNFDMQVMTDKTNHKVLTLVWLICFIESTVLLATGSRT